MYSIPVICGSVCKICKSWTARLVLSGRKRCLPDKHEKVSRTSCSGLGYFCYNMKCYLMKMMISAVNK